MKASLLTKLETLTERHEELSALLSDSQTIANQNKFRDLSREYAELEPVVACYAQYSQVKADLDEARQMLDDADPDVREMAREELGSGGERLASLEAELQMLLLPRLRIARRYEARAALAARSARLTQRIFGDSCRYRR